jgi:hypothetical protein
LHKAQSLINHVALVLDASYSMKNRAAEVIKATDQQIQYLAKRSAELNQETRVSVYRFGETTIECLIFDMDVARLPKTADLYAVLRENTSLLDAIMKSQKDLETTSQLYGDHAFLTFVLTDGEENRSRYHTKADLKRHIMGAPENWSMGFLVPDQWGVQYMEQLGVLRDSIAVWSIDSATGMHEAATAIQTATDNFMTARASGKRGTKSVFSTGVKTVNKKTVTKNLNPITGYAVFDVDRKAEIRDFVNSLGMNYKAGIGYYQLTKTETIQPTKEIIVVDKRTSKAYAGEHARDLVGLSDSKVRVRPDENPDYDVFVQSTSFNRHLLPNTRVLVRS